MTRPATVTSLTMARIQRSDPTLWRAAMIATGGRPARATAASPRMIVVNHRPG